MLRLPALTLAVLVLAAAPAAASERSDARKITRALQPELVLTPEEREGFVVAHEARAAHAAATCLDAVKDGATNDDRRLRLVVVYVQHLESELYTRIVQWNREARARLAALEVDTPALRDGLAARRRLVGWLMRYLGTPVPDFCGAVTEWQATGWKEEPATIRSLLRVYGQAPTGKRVSKRQAIAVNRLRRHGATVAELRAWDGIPDYGEFRDPAPDPVLDALGFEREDDSDRTPGTTEGALAGALGSN